MEGVGGWGPKVVGGQGSGHREKGQVLSAVSKTEAEEPGSMAGGPKVSVEVTDC